MSKQKFGSKSGFILASVGAAVGLGNALRFPGLCAKYGGGTYLFIYLVALVLLGVPLLNAEIALGRKVGGGAPECLESLKRGGARLGWAQGANSLVTSMIYAGLAGWIVAMIIKIAPLCADYSSGALSGSEVSGYFFKNVLHDSGDGGIYAIAPVVCLSIAAVWLIMFFCLKGGAKSLAAAAKFTVIIPPILLLFMAVRGMLYKEAPAALSALFIPDLKSLSNPQLWMSALLQVFFSISVAVGIMPTYGAYLPEGTNAFSCSLIICAADFLVSLIAAVALFTTLYGCGMQAEIGQSGIITAFAVYPVAITRLFGANGATANAVAGILFYGSLSMIAVQAAVSMAEAFLSPLCKTFNIKRTRAAAVVCAVGAGICLIYATSAAVLIVDVSDRFINFYNILILALSECLLLGSSKSLGGLAEEINRYTKRLKMPKKFFKISVGILSPAALFSLFVYEVVRLCVSGLDYPLWAQCGFGWGLSLAVFAAGWGLNKLHAGALKSHIEGFTPEHIP